MLEMGFQEEVQKIFDVMTGRTTGAGFDSGASSSSSSSSSSSADAAATRKVQVVLFSATLPSWIYRVANKYMEQPKTVDLVEDDNAASLDVQVHSFAC